VRWGRSDVKQQILTSDLPHLTGVAQKMLKTYEPEKLHQLLARMNA